MGRNASGGGGRGVGQEAASHEEMGTDPCLQEKPQGETLGAMCKQEATPCV